MKRPLPSFTVLLIALVSVAVALPISQAWSRVGRRSSLPVKRDFVVEWDVVSPNEATISEISKIQLLSEIEKSIKAYQSFHSWEAKYRVTSRQAPQERRDGTIPEMVETSHVHLISDGMKWRYETLQKVEKKTTNDNRDVNYRAISDGKVISMVWPDRKTAHVQSADQGLRTGQPTLVDSLPYLPTETQTTQTNFPEILDIVDSPDTKILRWYTRIGGHACYVLEQITTRKQPIFKTREQAYNWRRAHPTKGSRTIDVDPNAKPGDVRVTKTKIRLAIDPKLGFAIVRWAQGYETRIPSFRAAEFPDREITYDDFRNVSKGLFIPHEMVYTNYRIDRQGERRAAKETRLTVDEFTVNKQYQRELFKLDIPEGYSVSDFNMGIVYKVGDSKEQIDDLVNAAKARKDFYDKLRGKQSPSLEYSKWVNSAPIHLAEHKGRCIALHFWSIGCAPCIHELSRLQKQYGHTAEFSAGPLFISIHQFVDGDDLRQLKNIIKEHGLTFPVMVDAPDTAGRSWGKTFKKYRVFSVPTEVKIDQNGYFEEMDKDLVSTSSWWFKNPRAK